MAKLEIYSTLENVESDLRARVDDLRGIQFDFDRELCEKLAFYDSFMKRDPAKGRLNMKRYLTVMSDYYNSDRINEEASRLKGQLGFMFKVYTGQSLSVSDCEEGSRFHARATKNMRRVVRDLNDQYPGWSQLCKDLQSEFSDQNPKVIMNMMIDESLELLGRDLKKQEQEIR